MTYQVVKEVRQQWDNVPHRHICEGTKDESILEVLKKAHALAIEHAERVAVKHPFRLNNGFQFNTSNCTCIIYRAEEVNDDRR